MSDATKPEAMTAERMSDCERVIRERFACGEYDFAGRDLLAEVRRLAAALDAVTAERDAARTALAQTAASWREETESAARRIDAVVAERDEARRDALIARAQRNELAAATDAAAPGETPASVLAVRLVKTTATADVYREERDEAQAALVALREAERSAINDMGGPDAAAHYLTLAATPSALAGQVRARVLREAGAVAMCGMEHETGCLACIRGRQLFALADEAERAK